ESPLAAVAGTVLADAIEREEAGSPAQAARQADQVRTGCRVLGISLDPEVACDEPGFGSGDGLKLDQDKANLNQPDWVNFLLHGNDVSIRRSLQTFFPDEQHMVMITRLTGNASIEEEGEGALAVKAAWEDRDLEGTEIVVTGAPVLLK